LFDVTISPLGFIALGACDPLSPADPVISWVDDVTLSLRRYPLF
jgi:hypothetical protein